MALVSWAMDYISSKGLELYKWLYLLANFNVWLQYVVWVFYPLILILFATSFCQAVSPQAVGSGIPELKTIIRGAILHEYLTFRTFVAKAVGLTAVLSTGLPVGKEGPFVHIASICAALLSKLLSFLSGTLEEPSDLRRDVLTVGCAVGLGCCFGTPLGGVLFSIEVTCTYFAVRNYWRGFLGGTFSAFMFRVLSVWIKDAVTITALFKTNFSDEFPFDIQELPAFAIVGISCGFLGAAFVYLNRLFVVFMKKSNRVTSLLKKQILIYPTLVTLILTTLSFPPGVGKYMAAELMPRETINSLFDNSTWSKVTDPSTLGNSAIWFQSKLSIFLVLFIYFCMNFWMAAIACTMPIPCGAFIPVFNLGASLGRIVGETMTVLFPEGLMSHGKIYHIVPGGYAVIGAAAMTGAVTHTVSTAVICFELTGEIAHILPMMVAVILANMVAQGLQPSLYDSIIQIKMLPYLPHFTHTHHRYDTLLGDIMRRDLTAVASNCTYADLLAALRRSQAHTFPFVDTTESMMLLGSVERSELVSLLQTQLSLERRLLSVAGMAGIGAKERSSPRSSRPGPSNTFPFIEEEDGEAIEKERWEESKIKTSEAPSREKQQTEDTDRSRGDRLMHWLCPSKFRRDEESPKLKDTMTLEEIVKWEKREKDIIVNFENCHIEPSPFQLVEKTTFEKTHTLFSLLGLDEAYVTNLGRLVGVVGLPQIQAAVEGTVHRGVRVPPPLASFRDTEDTLKSHRMQVAMRKMALFLPHGGHSRQSQDFEVERQSSI